MRFRPNNLLLTKPRRVAVAAIDYTAEENDSGREQDCVFAICLETEGGRSGPIWGHHHASVLRALATLSAHCPFGAKFHRLEGEADPPRVRRGVL